MIVAWDKELDNNFLVSILDSIVKQVTNDFYKCFFIYITCWRN